MRPSRILRCGVLLAALTFGVQAHADDFARGRELFEPCQACHAREAGKTGMAGPDLVGLKGRRIGGAADFDYSPVLRRAHETGAVWDAARLMQFLADADAMFPGLWMSAQPIQDEADRRALAQYLLSDAR